MAMTRVGPTQITNEGRAPSRWGRASPSSALASISCGDCSAPSTSLTRKRACGPEAVKGPLAPLGLPPPAVFRAGGAIACRSSRSATADEPVHRALSSASDKAALTREKQSRLRTHHAGACFVMLVITRKLGRAEAGEPTRFSSSETIRAAVHLGDLRSARSLLS